MVFYIFGIMFICFVFLFFWMRWRMRASKGRFALAVVSTLLACLGAGLSAISTGLPVSIASKAMEALGLGPLGSGPPSALVLILTITAMVLIYRFGVSTIKAWDAPARVSEVDLAEKYLENNLAALTLEQFKLLFRGQKDRLASETATNWKGKISEPPKPVATRELLKDMLVSAISEIRINDDGWRSDGDYWVGEILGPRPEENRPIIALICEVKPNQRGLESRIEVLTEKYTSAVSDISTYGSK